MAVAIARELNSVEFLLVSVEVLKAYAEEETPIEFDSDHLGHFQAHQTYLAAMYRSIAEQVKKRVEPKAEKKVVLNQEEIVAIKKLVKEFQGVRGKIGFV